MDLRTTTQIHFFSSSGGLGFHRRHSWVVRDRQRETARKGRGLLQKSGMHGEISTACPTSRLTRVIYRSEFVGPTEPRMGAAGLVSVSGGESSICTYEPQNYANALVGGFRMTSVATYSNYRQSNTIIPCQNSTQLSTQNLINDTLGP